MNTKPQNHHLYLNNASKIAPYSIDKPLLSTGHNGHNYHDRNDTNCFEEQLTNVIQELLPPSFWKTHNNHTKTSVNCATDNTMKRGTTNNNTQCTSSDFYKNFQIQSLDGGLSNYLFTVTNRNTNDTVLVRLHPPSSSFLETKNGDESLDMDFTLIDREYENQIASFLSKYEMGPLFYGQE